jgi:hypothetical protein
LLKLNVLPTTGEVVVGNIVASRYDGLSGAFLGELRLAGGKHMYNGSWGQIEFAVDGQTLLFQQTLGHHFRFDQTGQPAPWPGRDTSVGDLLPHQVEEELSQGFMHSRGMAAAPEGGFYVLHHKKHRAFADGRVSLVGPDGKIARRDIVVTDVPVGSIRVGRNGNLYVGVHLKPAGELLPPWFDIYKGGHLVERPPAPAGWGSRPGQLPPESASWYVEQYGSVVKFAPSGGRLFTGVENGPYFAPVIGGDSRGWSPSWRDAKGSIGGEGVEWLWHGLAPMPSRRGTSSTLGGPRCSCETAHFDIDAQERLFVPDTFRFSIAVLDASANLITRFGRYGNQDDVGEGDAIPLGWGHAVAVHGDRAYVADLLNHRVVRVRLDSRLTVECTLPGEQP